MAREVPPASVYVFDVEGTLVDAVMPTLRCWRDTLAEFGHEVSLADLHHHSGMDAREMLAHLLPRPPDRATLTAMLERQGARYRKDYLATVHALPGAHDLIAQLKGAGCRVALTSDSARDEVERYIEITGIADMADAIACGDDVKHGRPHPDLIRAVMKQLRLRVRTGVLVVGDTPYDAEAAQSVGMSTVGLLSGHFSAADLLAAGCIATFRDPQALKAALARPAPAELAQAS